MTTRFRLISKDLQNQDDEATMNQIRTLQKEYAKLETQINTARKAMAKHMKSPQFLSDDNQALFRSHENNLASWAARQSEIRTQILSLQTRQPSSQTAASHRNDGEVQHVPGRSQSRIPETIRSEEEEDIYGDQLGRLHSRTPAQSIDDPQERNPNTINNDIQRNPRKRPAEDQLSPSPSRFFAIPKTEFLQMQQPLKRICEKKFKSWIS